MTDLRQAAMQALEALIDAANVLSAPMFADAVDALKAALKQPEKEPEAREGFEKWAKFAAPYMDMSRFEAGYSDCNTDYAWTGWQAALAQPQQQAEPVAWQYKTAEAGIFASDQLPQDVQVWQDIEWSIPLYTTPPQRKPLADEEIDDIWVEHGCEGEDAYGFARAIEAAHNIKEGT